MTIDEIVKTVSEYLSDYWTNIIIFIYALAKLVIFIYHTVVKIKNNKEVKSDELSTAGEIDSQRSEDVFSYSAERIVQY